SRRGSNEIRECLMALAVVLFLALGGPCTGPESVLYVVGSEERIEAGVARDRRARNPQRGRNGDRSVSSWDLHQSWRDVREGSGVVDLDQVRNRFLFPSFIGQLVAKKTVGVCG